MKRGGRNARAGTDVPQADGHLGGEGRRLTRLLFGIDRQVTFFNEHTLGFRFQMRHWRIGNRDLQIDV